MPSGIREQLKSPILYNKSLNAFTIILSLLFLLAISFNETLAISPSFSIQHIIDRADDAFLANRNYQNPQGLCFPKSSAYFNSDIAQADYISNGTTLNATVWTYHSFDDLSLGDMVIVSVPKNQSDNFRPISLDELLKLQLVTYKKVGNVIHYDTNASLAGSRAYEIISNYTLSRSNVTRTQYLIGTVVDGKLYSISYSTDRPVFQYMSEVRHMIESLEIEGAGDESNKTTFNVAGDESNKTTRDNSNFSTYQNSTQGIKIDYPSSWFLSPVSSLGPDVVFMPNVIQNVSTQDRIAALRNKTIEMIINVFSEYDNKKSDYDLMVSWNPVNQKWISTLSQISPTGTEKILDRKDNSSGFFNVNDHYYDLSLDLKELNYPKNYSALIAIQDSSDILCRVTDFTNWALFPAPKTSTTILPTSISLRPGEEGTVQFKIKSDITRDSLVELHANSVNDIDVSFTPSNFSLPSFSEAASTLKIKAPSEFTNGGSNLINVNQTLSFAPVIFDVTRNSTQVEKTKLAPSSTNKIIPITVTLLPPLTTEEWLSNFVHAWITPIGALWTFLVAVAAVVSPLLIRIYRSKLTGSGAPVK